RPSSASTASSYRCPSATAPSRISTTTASKRSVTTDQSRAELRPGGRRRSERRPHDERRARPLIEMDHPVAVHDQRPARIIDRFQNNRVPVLGGRRAEGGVLVEQLRTVTSFEPEDEVPVPQEIARIVN